MEFPTGIGTSDATSINLLGHDLAGELIGHIGFGELALWLATQKQPTPQQVRVFEAVLVSLADHGFTPTAIAARLTLYSAPDALQGHRRRNRQPIPSIENRDRPLVALSTRPHRSSRYR